MIAGYVKSKSVPFRFSYLLATESSPRKLMAIRLSPVPDVDALIAATPLMSLRFFHF
jgi:hypothetical protein